MTVLEHNPTPRTAQTASWWQRLPFAKRMLAIAAMATLGITFFNGAQFAFGMEDSQQWTVRASYNGLSLLMWAAALTLVLLGVTTQAPIGSTSDVSSVDVTVA